MFQMSLRRSRYWIPFVLLLLLGAPALVSFVPQLAAAVKGAHLTSLDPHSGILGADISPDNRLVAIYGVNQARQGGQTTDVYELQIWDWRARKVVSRKALYQEPSKMLGIVPQFLRYADNGSKLVVYKTGHLLTLYTATLDLVRDVDLEMPQWPWTDSDVRRDRVIKGSISDMEVDSAGSRVALLIPWGTHAGGELRVYDLDSGRLVQKWDFPSGLKDGEDPENGLAFYSSRPISISPDGKIVAISLGLPVSGDGVVPSQGKNVLILDVDSGKTVAGINTGSLAGPMCFVPGNPLELATLSLYFHEKNPATNSIRLWNAQTGLLVREIRTSRFAVGQSLDVSADGHILMGFTSRLKYDFSWLGNEYGAKIFDPRIGLWDLTTGKEVAGSSSLLQLLSSGFSYRFRLSPDGHVVLLYANVYRAEEKTKPLYQLHFFEFR